MTFRINAIFKRFLFLATLLAVTTLVGKANGQTPNPDPGLNPFGLDAVKTVQVMKHPQPDLLLLVAHRGDHTMLSNATGVPENSIESIRRAAAAGLEMVEVDIRTTSDGIPILSHDETWGRETDYCAPSGKTFDPLVPLENTPGPAEIAANEACNPKVNSLSLLQLRTLGVHLRDSVDFTVSTEQPSTLQEVLDYLKQNRIGMVLALDIKSPTDAQACWGVIQKNTDYLGRASAATTVFRIGASAYQNTAAFKSAFGSNYSAVNYWPTYGTSVWGPPPNGFGSENAAIYNLQQFQADSTISLVAAEVQIKEIGGILSNLIYDARHNISTGSPSSVTEFHPISEWTNPTNPSLAEFYGTAGLYRGAYAGDPRANTPLGGHCCITLDYYLYQGTIGQPSDQADNRTDINFIMSNKPNIITTDDSVNFASTLASEGLRNLSYIRSDNYSHQCDTNGRYPGCDTDGTTVYTYCATAEGGTCSFAGTRNVAYGANGLYNYKTVTNFIACNLSSFGPPDPSYGVHKACYYSPALGTGDAVNPPPSGNFAPAVYCADENGVCSFSGEALGRFVATPSLLDTPQTPFQNSFNCNLSTFSKIGDPYSGVVKTCAYQLVSDHLNAGPPGYVLCADGDMGQTCTFAGAARIAYGANGAFEYRTFSLSSAESLAGGVPCEVSEFFRDPNFGVYKSCYYQLANPVSSSGALGSNPSGGGLGNTPPGGGLSNGANLTCDLYASGGTPCVAAHSTVRALFGGYSGRLYQVQRASDGSTTDIGTLAAGGYANATAQDSFCANTTCTITIIYDQTSQHNDLAIEGPGGAVQSRDSGAVANALPISLNGNEVYGVKVTPGVGYRNNATSGVAKNQSPEGMYMVTSGTYVNSGCCFDYGNAEENSGDNGNGHMDAINFGTACVFAPCSGSGPWVEADLENGQYMGNGSNLGDQSIGSDFVTAMLKNNGQTTFALKAGNAQSGALTTEYSGSLPTIKSGYTPMSLEGGIVLGTGGDNSNASLGAFFEGAMTSGYPTDATEDAVQANIVSAAYSGNSGGSSSAPPVPQGPYTGPSDPDGPGPQDGFASPATEQPNDVMATKPSFVSFSGSLYVAFQGVGVNNDLYVTSSPTGNNFPSAPRYTNLQSSSAPALAVFNNQLFMAFRGLNVDNDFYITSSPTGSNFPTATRYTNIQMGGAPALAVFNNQLCASFQANDPGHALHLTCSSDGVTWPTAPEIFNVQIGSDPAMTVFNGVLYVAFRANDASNLVWIASSSDGVNFTSQPLLGQTTAGTSSPALVVSNNVLYCIYGANDTNNEMLVTTSLDGSTWNGPAAYLNVKMGAAGPGAAEFLNGVTVGFQSNDSRNVLFVTSKVTGAASYTGPSDPGGSGPQDGFTSPATEQPNDVMGTKPSFASFNGSLYVAFEGVGVNNDLYVTSSSTGNNFPAATQYTNIQMSSAPALAAFNKQLYVAFRGLGVDNDFYITSSSTGSNFPAAPRYTNIQMGGAPALTAFNNQLFAAFRSDDPRHLLFITSSSDGYTWPTAWGIPNVQIGSDPAMAVFNGRLYVAFRANDPSNLVWIASSSDGVNFTSQPLLGQTMGYGSSPALAVSNGVLYYIYEANDSSHEMLVTASTDGSTWQGPAAYLNNKVGTAGPAATGFGNGVTVGFQSNDSRNVLYVTTKP